MEESPIYIAFVFLVMVAFFIYTLVDHLNGREKTKEFHARIDERREKEEKKRQEFWENVAAEDAAKAEASLQEQRELVLESQAKLEAERQKEQAEKKALEAARQREQREQAESQAKLEAERQKEQAEKKAIQESRTATTIQNAKNLIAELQPAFDSSSSKLPTEAEMRLFYETSRAIFMLEDATAQEFYDDENIEKIQSEITKYKILLNPLNPLERLKKRVGNVDDYIAKSIQLIDKAANSPYPDNLKSLDAALNHMAPFCLIHNYYENIGFYEDREEIKLWREKYSSFVPLLKLGYEKAINGDIPDQKIRGIVHSLAFSLEVSQMFVTRRHRNFEGQNSHLIWKPNSRVSVFDNSTVDILEQKINPGARQLEGAIDQKSKYHLEQAEKLLDTSFKRTPQDETVVGILFGVHRILRRNTKISREVAYLWGQIKSDNLKKGTQKEVSPPPTSTVIQGVAFEERCTRLFEAMGYTVRQTAMTGDGGIDLELVDNTPIKGGSMIVQCKDWRTQTVGVSVVRDLFGLVVSESKNKGIVVTSGKFTKESEDFAEDKTIELIDGAALAALEREHISTNSE